MNQLPQFFDWRGELGRLAYLRKVIQRILILIVVMGFNLGLNALMGIEIDSPSYIAEQSSLISVAALIIFVPIDIKRLNDLANAAMKAEHPGMKQIWTDKWYALVKQYANTIEKQKENVK